jgi:membrane peptidoglycan carboxypeptidase
VTLGGGEVKLLELTNAYSTFANGGVKTEPISILEVKTREGNVLEEFKPQKGRQVLTEEEAFMMSHILSDNTARQITFGANSLLNVPGRTVAVKTGTTNDLRDNWAIGWTPQVVVGVWVGNNDNSRMESVASGVSGATPIWRRSIMAALNSKPAVEFEKPDGIVTISLDKISGYPSHDGFESKDALIIKGTQYTGEDPIHVKLKVCRDQNDRLAPDALVAKGEYDEKEFYVFREDDPLFGNADNHWQKGIDEWIATQEDERYRPPTEFCDVDVKLGISFESPGNHEKVDNDFEIRVRVGGSVDIEKIEFYANGKKIGEVKDRPYRMDVHLDDGAYELKAVAVGKDDQKAEAVRRIGVNKDWDWEPEPTPTPTPTPSPTPEPTPSPTPEPDDELEI